MDSRRQTTRTPAPATPRPTPPRDARTPHTPRSPQLGLRDADIVRQLTATSR